MMVSEEFSCEETFKTIHSHYKFEIMEKHFEDIDYEKCIL